MPTQALKTMAEKAGVSMVDAERYWNEAKKQADVSAPKDGFTKGDSRYWAYVMSIVQKRLQGHNNMTASYAEILSRAVAQAVQAPTRGGDEPNIDDAVTAKGASDQFHQQAAKYHHWAGGGSLDEKDRLYAIAHHSAKSQAARNKSVDHAAHGRIAKHHMKHAEKLSKHAHAQGLANFHRALAEYHQNIHGAAGGEVNSTFFNQTLSGPDDSVPRDTDAKFVRPDGTRLISCAGVPGIYDPQTRTVFPVPTTESLI